jgi:tRNA dimethylallyltransferase
VGRLEARARAHLGAGFLDEVRALLDAGHREWLLRMRAVSYVQAIDLIDGRLDPDTYVAEVVRANRRLARKQLSWFRRDPRVRWFDATHIERAVSEIRAYYGASAEG